MTFAPNDLSALHQAMLHTVSYADIFDYPLTAAEIHRYLGLSATLETVQSALPGPLVRSADYYTLPGRAAIVSMRQRRQQIASSLWPHALHYGRLIARLPFVRMVAVTGSLAMDNVEAGADLDYLIVTAPGRLWLCRALILLLGRFAALQGAQICPNYLVTQNALDFSPQNLYAAHELTQMVPLAGMDVYRQIRAANPWAESYLPNASGPPQRGLSLPQPESVAMGGTWLEGLLLIRPVDRLEAWEMTRKIRKLRRQNGENPEATFSADCCKGHSQQHGQKTMQKVESIFP